MRDNLEKSLKRWLKKKVSITTAIVVAFLITGNIGYAKEPIGEIVNQEEEMLNGTSQTFNRGEDYFEVYISIIPDNIKEQIGEDNIDYVTIETGSYIDTIKNINGKSFFGKTEVENININNNEILEVKMNGINIEKNLETKIPTQDIQYSIAEDKKGVIIKGNTSPTQNENIHYNLGNGIGIYGRDEVKRDNNEININVNINNSSDINGTIEKVSSIFNITKENDGTLSLLLGNSTIGNGIGIFSGVTSNTDISSVIKGNVIIKDGINNTGNILGNIGNIQTKINYSSQLPLDNSVNFILENLNMGNGIGILSRSSSVGSTSNIEIENIKNQGSVLGKIENLNIEENLENNEKDKNYLTNLNLGNGIGIGATISTNQNNILIKNIQNTNEIKGKIGKIDLNLTSLTVVENLNLGNGIGVYSNQGNIEIKNIENSGLISGEITSITENDKNNSKYINLGNGIGIYSKGNINIGTIKNNSNNNLNGIYGKVDSLKIKESHLIGNGISIVSENNQLKLNEIENNGNIEGNISIIEGEKINESGNGILISSSSLITNDSKLKILNSGNIIGNIDTLKTDSSNQVGNGILLSSGTSDNSQILDFNNTGKIKGSITNNETESLISSGNGVFLGVGKINYNINNDGVIIGEVNIIGNKNSVLVSSGNGTEISGDIFISNFLNSGLSLGKINNSNENLEMLNSGNGLIIVNPTLSSELTINSLENSGILKGNIQGINKIDEFSGNGLAINFEGTLNMKNLNNEGYISGNINSSNENISIPNSGNGINLNTLNTFNINNIDNSGVILGKITNNLNLENSSRMQHHFLGNGITMFSGSNTEINEITDFNNSGLILGETKNIHYHSNNPLYGMGNGIEIIGRDIKVGNFINEGTISGNIDTLTKDDTLYKTYNILGNGVHLGAVHESEAEMTDNYIITNFVNNGVISGYYSKTENVDNNILGNGVIFSTTNFSKESQTLKIENLSNTGVILGKESGISYYDYGIFSSNELELNDIIKNYINYGIIIGQTPLKLQISDKIFKIDNEIVADKGYAIVLNEDTTVKEVVGKEGKNSEQYSLDIFNNGENKEYSILNTKISEDKTDAWQEFGTENFKNHIINGVGENSGVITVRAGEVTSLDNGIVNAYKTAITIGDNSTFTGTNVIINGGGLRGSEGETEVIKGTDLTNNLNLAGNIQINGSIDLMGNNDNDTINFGVSNKENLPNSTKVNIYDEIKNVENINLKNNTDLTLYETSKVIGTDNIHIEAGSQLTLRVDSSIDAGENTYKTHALYNNSDETLVISGDVPKEDTTVEETENGKYSNLSVLDIVTNGLGVNSTIELGNVKFETNEKINSDIKEDYTQNNTEVWVKTNSILHGAKVYQDQLTEDKYDTKIKIEAEKDLFSIINKIEGTPLEPATKYVGDEYNFSPEKNIEGNNGIEKIFSGVNGKVERYNNAGTIIGKYSSTDNNSKIGNGMIYATSENNLSMKRIENTGDILGIVQVESNPDNPEIEIINKNSGNGIALVLESNSIFQDKLDHTLTLEEGIVNSGVIEGKAINNAKNGKNINSGNGINISSELKEGEVSNIKIAVADGKEESKVKGIINNGFILGELTGKDKTVSEFSGNGIAMTFKGAKGNIEIGNIENTGVIKSIHNATVTNLNSTGSNNGIIISDSSEGTLTLGKIENNGLIDIERNINPNNNLNTESHIVSESYNGIVVENNNKGNTLDFGTIENNGSILVSGKSNVDVHDKFSLNGVYVGTTGNITGTIKNDGKIASGWGSSDADSQNYGNGVLIYSTEQNKESTITLDNTGLIVGKENAVAISQDSKMKFNYANYGVIAGKNLVSASGYDDDKSVGFGLGIKLDENGNIANVLSSKDSKENHALNIFEGDKNSQYSIINTEIKDKDAFNEYNENTNLSNVIINGAGNKSGTVTIADKKEFVLNNGVVNAYKTAITIGDNSTFTGTNVIINGGGLVGSGNETDVIKGNDDVKLNLAGEIHINGSIDLDSNGNTNDNDTLTFGNGEIRTEAGIFDTIKGADTIDIGKNTDITLYETSKLEGTKEINIAKGGELSLRVDANKTEEINGKTYIVGHALYNNGNNIVIKGEGATDGVQEQDKDIIDGIINGDSNLSDITDSKENHGKENYKDSSVLDIVTNGLGRNSLIALGDVTIEDTNKLWIKTNSILTKAELQEQSPIKTLEYVDEEIKDPGTVIKVEAEKDIFGMGNNPDKPVDKNEKLYIKLNEIYKGIYTSGDRNFNALNDIVTNFTFSDKDKGDYPIIGNEQMQMATLLGYLRSVYAETPYSFSNEATRKSMGLFHDTVRDNDFKAKDKEWLIYGGFTHQNGDQEQTYYGRNYHGFDTGTADTDVNIKLTGAYGQFEYGNSETLSTGLLLGGTKSDVSVAHSKLDGTSAYIGAYAKKDIKDFRLIAGVGYQYSEYDGTRNTINQSYSQDYKDRGVNLYLDGKYSYNLGNNFYLEPKAGLSYTYITQEGITENQEQTLALDVDSKEFNVLEGTVGLDVKKVIPTENGKHSISAGVTYRSILNGDEADYLTANYGGSDFEILIPHKNKNQVSVGAKYEVELENGMFYNVKGNYFMNVDSKENTNKNADTGEWRVGLGFGYRFNSVKDLNPIVMLRDFSLKADSYFDFDKSELKQEGKSVIKEISTELNKDNTQGTLKIEGHTDSVGTREYNQKLSEKRAKSVEDEFKKNITTDKIKYDTKGYGEDKPIADNSTKEGRAKNRRVDIKFEGVQEN